MRQFGGAVRVKSEPDTGTVFQMLFKAADATDAPTLLHHTTGTEIFDFPLRVLLVEDEETVRKIITRQLQQCGLTVVAAADSATAQDAYAADGPFDIVVSDIVMPGELQGPDLILKLRETNENLPAILLSGYPQDAAIYGKNMHPNDVMLMKPVGREDLLAAIHMVMNPPS